MVEAHAHAHAQQSSMLAPLHTRMRTACGMQLLLEELREAGQAFSRSLGGALAFLDARHQSMLGMLERQAAETRRQVKVRARG